MPVDRKKIVLLCLGVAAVITGVAYAFNRWQRNGYSDASNVSDPGWFAQDPSLKFVTVLFRHGTRGPIHKYKTNPHVNAFPEGEGELTKHGKQIMYKKGQIFRRMYNKHISDLYMHNEISTKTTRMRRTFMSAAMVLAGMYPPKSYQRWSDSDTVWQPIPIFSDSPDHGTLFNDHGKCPYFDSIAKKVFRQVPLNTDKNLTEPLYSYLSEKCGQPINRANLMGLYDIFLCQISEGLKLPEWLTPEIIQTIRSITMKPETLKLFYGNPEFQYFFVGPLMKEIASDMEMRINGSVDFNAPSKMQLYSGHDLTLTMIMGFLGNIIETPTFGASLHIHLHHEEINGHIVKFFFYNRWDDEEGIQALTPSCGNPCKVQDFIKLVAITFPGEWEESCHKKES